MLLGGPTAVGKTEVALLLAEKLHGEIVSVDSMQVYRGMDIGTAKPSAAELARVPHHLLNVVELTEPFDAARFAALARTAVVDIQARQRVPILCGGTGLYFSAFLHGVGPAPAADPVLRAELKRIPLPELLEELALKDPAMLAQIDQRNPRRVIRAIEVIRLTGRPYSEQRQKRQGTPAHSVAWVLTRAPKDLRERIHRRVDEMFTRGLVAETERLLARGLEQNEVAMQALGYRQVAEYLRGQRSLEGTIELVKLRTRQFAKRQLTWFRRQFSATWVCVSDSPEEVAARIATHYREPGRTG
jgi:tRNA dimethylallyltransferase